MVRVGNQIYIDFLSEDDVSDKYSSWLSNPKVNKFLESRWKKYRLAELREFINEMSNDMSNFLFGIYHSDNGEHIGNIKLGDINYIHRYGDIGLIIGEERFWGRGIGYEAVRLVVDFAFNQLNLNKVTAGLYSNNCGSRRIFEKNDFKCVGTREQHVFVEGQYIDVMLFEKLNR